MRLLIRSKSLIAFAVLTIPLSLGAQQNSSGTGLPLAASGTWTLTGSLHNARDGHTATLLQNGNVLVAGGEKNNITLGTSELYNPAAGTWTLTGNLNIDRASAQAVPLSSVKALGEGGCTG